MTAATVRRCRVPLLAVAVVLVLPLLVPDHVDSRHAATGRTLSTHEDAGVVHDTDRLYRLSAPRDAKTQLWVSVDNVTPRAPVHAVALRVVDAWGREEATVTREWKAETSPAAVQAGGVRSEPVMATPALLRDADSNESRELVLELDLVPGVHHLVVGTENADAVYHVRIRSDHYGARVDHVHDAPTLYRFLHSGHPDGWAVAEHVVAPGVLRLQAAADLSLGHPHNGIDVRLDRETARFRLSVALGPDSACTATSAHLANATLRGEQAGHVATKWTAPGLHRIDVDVAALGGDTAHPSHPPEISVVAWDLGVPVPYMATPRCTPAEAPWPQGAEGPLDKQPRQFGLGHDLAPRRSVDATTRTTP